jgi:hypothetical protein
VSDDDPNRTRVHWLLFAVLLLMVVASLIGAYLQWR